MCLSVSSQQVALASLFTGDATPQLHKTAVWRWGRGCWQAGSEVRQPSNHNHGGVSSPMNIPKTWRRALCSGWTCITPATWSSGTSSWGAFGFLCECWVRLECTTHGERHIASDLVDLVPVFFSPASSWSSQTVTYTLFTLVESVNDSTECFDKWRVS